MLIKRAADTYEKIQALGGMASDDILSRPGQAEAAGGTGGDRGPCSAPRNNPAPGVYRSALPNGKYVNLMRVMFTDFCKMDCAFCPNSHWVPRRRFAFKVDELANAFMEMYRRHTVAGLFLSSGVAGTGSKTTEKMTKVVDLIRNKHGFRGYIHMKVMPGTEEEYVEAAYRLGTRLSVNLEAPNPELMSKLSAMKEQRRDILAPMGWIDRLTRSTTNGAVGQATQLVVGAADETDWDIFERIDQLYGQWDVKRVYYAAFRPVRHTPLEEHPPTPLQREHRLYQVDWLKRVYRYSNEELKLAFADDGLLPLDADPKTSIAVYNLDGFPVDVNAASREELLRVPGIGPTSAQRIVANRLRHSIDAWRDLQAMGVVRKRAWPFLALPGHRPPRARQLKLDLFRADAERPRLSNAPAQRQGRPAQSTAPCGVERSCTGCPLYGAPGHPGSEMSRAA